MDAHSWSGERMPLVDLLRDYRDGDERGWEEEFAWLWANHPEKLWALTSDIAEYGIRKPILLGTDGRVWDGHHRLCVASDHGFTSVPVRLADAS